MNSQIHPDKISRCLASALTLLTVGLSPVLFGDALQAQNRLVDFDGSLDTTIVLDGDAEVGEFLESFGLSSSASPLVIPAAAFVGDGGSADTFFSIVDGMISGDSADCIQAPVHLPSGVSVTSLIGYVYDNDPKNYGLWVSLWEKAYGDSSEASLMAEVESPGAVGTVQALATTSISDATIDNDSNAYFVAACVNSDLQRLSAVSIHFEDDGVLNVASDSGDTQVLVQETNETYARRQLFRIENNGPPEFALNDKSNDLIWKFGTRGTQFEINRSGSGATELALKANGDLKIAGTLSQGSSRTLKEDFRTVDTRKILDRVNELPLLDWTYKTTDAGDRHFGPMAEDFHETFGLGADPERLAPGDAAGIALAAIQGLNGVVDERLLEKDAEIDALRSEIEALRSLVEEIAR